MLALSIIVSVDWLFLRGPPLESEYSNVSPPEGRVAEGVAEGVDGGVDVAEAVGDLPHQLGDDAVTLLGPQDPLYSSYFYNTIPLGLGPKSCIVYEMRQSRFCCFSFGFDLGSFMEVLW